MRLGPLVLFGVAAKMTRRLAGTVIASQAFVIFFGALVARGIASANGESGGGTWLWVGSVLAVLCLLDAGLLRRPWGITLGWLLQVATLLAVFVVPAMLVVGILFTVLWVTALVQGRSMDAHTAEVDAAWYEAHAEPEPGAEPDPGTRHTDR